MIAFLYIFNIYPNKYICTELGPNRYIRLGFLSITALLQLRQTQLAMSGYLRSTQARSGSEVANKVEAAAERTARQR